MLSYTDRVDVTALAEASGFRVLRGALRCHDRINGGADEPAPVWFSRLLWARLGGEEDDAAYRRRAQRILRAAHEVVVDRMVEGNDWRAHVVLSGDPGLLWVVYRGAAIEIAFGPGDLWPGEPAPPRPWWRRWLGW